LLKPSDFIVIASVAAGVGAAAVIDIKTRRVPNWLTALLASTGLLLALSGISGLTVVAALSGIGVGLLLMLPAHVIGATGAGDVKLLAATGALIGPMPIARAFLYTAIAGGALALFVAWRRNRLQTTFGRVAALVTSPGSAVAVIDAPLENNRFPYAPAIAIGSLIAAIGL
jgi:prepilin peptidase CpaA